jgi:ferredoxin-NADP reductase/ferredoxin
MSDHTIVLNTRDGQSLSFTCAENEDVIAAAEKADIYLNAQCRSGSCGACIARRENGELEFGEHSDDALSEADVEQGNVLLCCTRPRSDLKLVLPYEHDLIRFEKTPVREATISAKTYLTPDTVKLELQLLPDEDGTLSLDFEPGQFVQLGVPGSDLARPYSLANAPNWDGALEFLIKLRPHGEFSSWLHEIAEPGRTLSLEGPSGTFVLRDNGLRPRYFVAGGCGIASVMSMLRRMAEWQEPHPVKLFFGLWNEAEVFYREELAALAADYPQLEYSICVAQASDTWPGCHGSAVDAFAAALDGEATEPDVYICGSPGLIEAVAEAAAVRGISRERLVFERFLATARAGQATCCEVA